MAAELGLSGLKNIACSWLSFILYHAHSHTMYARIKYHRFIMQVPLSANTDPHNPNLGVSVHLQTMELLAAERHLVATFREKEALQHEQLAQLTADACALQSLLEVWSGCDCLRCMMGWASSERRHATCGRMHACSCGYSNTVV